MSTVYYPPSVNNYSTRVHTKTLDHLTSRIAAITLSRSLKDDCGEWVTSLCPTGESGCPDSQGDYDVLMPAPTSGTSSSGYKIRVADMNDEESVDCSESFTLLPSEELPTVGEVDGPTLVVTSPMDGDMAEACMEYTVEVRKVLFVQYSRIPVQNGTEKNSPCSVPPVVTVFPGYQPRRNFSAANCLVDHDVNSYKTIRFFLNT